MPVTENTPFPCLLTQKWGIEFMQSTEAIFPVRGFSSIQFFSNGCVSFNSAMVTEAIWSYEAGKKNISIDLQAQLWRYKIIVITKNNLVLKSLYRKKNAAVFFWRIC